ncbi:CU044_5270 family protein [Nonomuraea sp. NPDC046802]|uniref:CU044_5270 family protein n=1 Tax=Nonomuraea sp. NPDC046802 TaxID=3154919 RepID=UPI0033CEE3AC
MIDELDLLKSHYDDLPRPSAEAVARARSLLAAEAAGAPAEPSRDAFRSGDSGRGRPLRMGGAPRRLLRGRFALRGAVVVGLAAAMTAGAITWWGDTGAAPPASAAELLRNAAASAVTAAPGPGQFTYVDRLDYDWAQVILHGPVLKERAQEVRREVWLPAGDPGKALARSTFAAPDPDAGDPGFGRPAGTVEYQRAGQCQMDVLHLPVSNFASLPADPDQLLAQVRRDAEAVVRSDKSDKPTEEEIALRVERTTVSKLSQLAETPLADPRTRTTVYEALARLPTTTMVSDLTDLSGRHGVGASIRYRGPDGWERQELIFEQKTYRFLGWSLWIQLEQADGRTKDTMIDGTAVLDTKVVDTMPEVPKDAKAPMLC